MKRSDVVKLIENWLQPEILVDVYNFNKKEWADNLLHTLETEFKLQPPEIFNDEYGVFLSQWEDEY